MSVQRAAADSDVDSPPAAGGSVLRGTYTRLNGTRDDIARYRGDVVLVVNTATECGFTPQFEGLEALYRGRRADGLVVLGFPTDDFAQESRSDDEIAEFCEANDGVTFPMFSKTVVTGGARTPCFAGSAPRPVRRSGTSTSISSTVAERSSRGSVPGPSRTPRSSRSGSTRCCDSVRTRTYVLICGRANLPTRTGRYR